MATDRTLEELQAALDRSRAETRSAFENRAFMYAYLYEELAEDLGSERAVEIMKRAIYRRGLEVGRKYAEAAESGDLAEVGRIFVDGSPCEGALFEPAIEELQDAVCRRHRFRPTSHSHQILGFCSDCAGGAGETQKRPAP